MDIRIQKIYEALFAIEDLREIYRQSLPTGLSEDEEQRFSEGLTKAEGILKDLKAGKGSAFKYVVDGIELRTREEGFINIQPIQPGGRLTPEARKVLITYGDGYSSTCDWCRKPFRLSKVDTIESFDKVAKTHKRRGFFFSDELKKRGIVGEFAGATRIWKLNTYGLSWDQIKYLGDAFCDIAMKYNIEVV